MDIELQYIYFRLTMTVMATFGVFYTLKDDNKGLRYFCASIILVGILSRIVGWLL